ncbi:hypothetical protein ACFV2U_50620 [Streptomyces sp. NPDC059697]|uniref:hypothetical protein n=1 Tax=Streptomyces sp. NPDC059697 TaxID=3346912 RepID=UPI0036C0E285
MSAAVADPRHPAHAFMLRRSKTLDRLARKVLGLRHAAPARVLVAVMEGLQIQWLRDPSVDVVGEMKALHTALTTSGAPRITT